MKRTSGGVIDPSEWFSTLPFVIYHPSLYSPKSLRKRRGWSALCLNSHLFLDGPKKCKNEHRGENVPIINARLFGKHLSIDEKGSGDGWAFLEYDMLRMKLEILYE
ncbi:hypothetical protein NPIL_427181 [Nephila pilipes]|uniref:Uncharacterized protein n=1 Tax=Nephila pilipes TaxID=299642 RepID=A0A8X6IQI8_NEPPI|nr:hypothetical protein NPIL_427181 [Nephila pilipes]